MQAQHIPLYIGLMSGTSLDGVDGVLTEIPDGYAGGKLTTQAVIHLPFPAGLRVELHALQAAGPNEIEREALAANALAKLYAESVAQLLAQSGQAREQVRAIGVHGQTIRHRPELCFTRQSNNPALLAELTGIDVIADFRSRDLAAGGQGAPLVPAFHQAVFGQPHETRVVVNIGGIANISMLHADGQVNGFDTGPGNVLLDGWIARQQGKAYDADGAWAASGTPHPPLLARLHAERYFSLPPPKSTGRDLFHLDWLDQHLTQLASLPAAHDVQATLAALTAETIAAAIAAYAPDVTGTYVCGGGAFNTDLLHRLEQALRRNRLTTSLAPTSALGIPPEQVEALAFAWLAQRFCRHRAGNLPAVTGARGPRVLGALYPA